MAVRIRLSLVLVVVLCVNLLGAGAAVLAQATPTGEATPTNGEASAGPVDLDVLFIGAHPDDEAFGLATYGQWNEFSGVTTGVVTITRGEGGGNAAGPEEGPALGIIREAEERRAVGRAGIEDIFYLDKVDFYYTVSAPLTDEVWGHDDTLARIVRVVRMTHPDVIVTMNPSPTPGNHGNHQMAARFAVEAFYAAADSAMFPEQLSDEGLATWQVKRLFRGGADGDGPPGPDCATTFQQAESTDFVYSVWSGVPSDRNYGTTWAQIAREGQREYVSQGWAVFPDEPTDPAQLRCGRFTQVDSRVPFTPGNSEPTGMLEGAIEPAAGGLPLGTEFYLTTDVFYLVPGATVAVTAHARPAEGESLDGASVSLTAPDGWNVAGDGALAAGDDGSLTADFTVTAAADAATETRVRLDGTITAGSATGTTSEVVQVVPVVRGTMTALESIALFRAWTEQIGVPQLDNLIKARDSIGTGQTRDLTVELTNYGEDAQSGQVTLELPAGFSTETTSMPYSDLAPGASGSVTFPVTNSDPTLPTAIQGGVGGDYDLTITTESAAGSSSQTAGLNLVPVTVVPYAEQAPAVDGVASPGEYTGPPLDLSRVWEGSPPDTAADVSGTAKVSWTDEGLYIIVDVTDDTLGTVLPPDDAKRHWRTDSVEVAIDPLGDSENTSTTFKVGVFPTTDDPDNDNPPAAYRDADNHQGPVADTAPGFEVASYLNTPFTGYTLEMKIPFDALPAPIDPDQAALNIFIYDSDTQDKTGQTRLGWSVYGGVQGDPYRWGLMQVADFGAESATPVAASPVAAETSEPVMPLEAAQSANSPQSILQSATNGVPLAGGPAAPDGQSAAITDGPAVEGSGVTVTLDAQGPGSANLFIWDGEQILANQSVTIPAAGTQTVTVQVADPSVITADTWLLVAFQAEGGGTASLAKQFGG
jgi:LmbE family N-acetylglucosaminyl deacetylase